MGLRVACFHYHILMEAVATTGKLSRIKSSKVAVVVCLGNCITGTSGSIIIFPLLYSGYPASPTYLPISLLTHV